jgi:hypothetical protein
VLENKCREEREHAFLVALMLQVKMTTLFDCPVREDFKHDIRYDHVFLHLTVAMAPYIEALSRQRLSDVLEMDPF